MTNTIECGRTKHKQIAMSLMTNTMECDRTKYKQVAMSSMTNTIECDRTKYKQIAVTEQNIIECHGRPRNNSHKAVTKEVTKINIEKMGTCNRNCYT